MEILKDHSGKNIGMLKEVSDSQHQVLDASGKLLGWYNPQTDQTHDRSGRMLGKGDQRGRFIKG